MPDASHDWRSHSVAASVLESLGKCYRGHTVRHQAPSRYRRFISQIKRTRGRRYSGGLRTRSRSSNADKIFEMFFTTKRKAWALALPCAGQLWSHMAEPLRFQRSPLGGCKFEVLPAECGAETRRFDLRQRGDAARSSKCFFTCLTDVINSVFERCKRGRCRTKSRQDQSIAYVIDDDAGLRDGISALLRSVDIAVETFGSTKGLSAQQASRCPGMPDPRRTAAGHEWA